MNPHQVFRRALRETDRRRRRPEYVRVRLWRIFTVADEPDGNTARDIDDARRRIERQSCVWRRGGGQHATSVLTIANTGTGILTVTGMSSTSGLAAVYKASWVSGTIAPGGSQAVTITFAPAAAVSYDGMLRVETDGTSGTNTIQLSGAGSAASKVSLAGVVTSDAWRAPQRSDAAHTRWRQRRTNGDRRQWRLSLR